MIHHAIVTEEPGGYLVSVLRNPDKKNDQNTSYVELLVKPDSPLHKPLNESCSVLNIAGTGNELETVGEAFQAGVFHVIISQELYNSILKEC